MSSKKNRHHDHERKHPLRVIPIAMYVAVGGLILFVIVATWTGKLN